MPKCDFNKVVKQLYWNYTSHGCSSVNLLHIFRTHFLRAPLEGCLWPLQYAKIVVCKSFYLIGALSGLSQLLETGSTLKMMKDAFNFTKALFVLKIFQFLSWLFGYVEKRLDEVNFKTYDATWKTNTYNANIPNTFKK